VVPCRLRPQRPAGPVGVTRAAAVAVALVAAALLGGCGGGSTGGGGGRRGGPPPPPTPPPTTLGAGGPSVTVGIICMTPTNAAQAFVAAWTAGDRSAAGRCAMPDAVTTIFTRLGAGAGWTFQGCGGPDPGVPICTFTYPGGTAQLTLMGTEAAGWKVSQVAFG
jgi:hypothetical protein